MTIPSKLSGGTLITRDLTQKVSPYTEPAFIRIAGSLDLAISAACMALFREASLLRLGSPDSAWAEVAVREVEGVKYILIAPTDEQNPLKIRVARRQNKTGLIRTADDVLKAAGVAMVQGFAYKMPASLVEDDTYGHVIAASWTHAQQEPQPKK